ncbi:linoleate 13S-lipoxygenase 2-1, chloroplastic-like protein [Tanacetum coccineum]
MGRSTKLTMTSLGFRHFGGKGSVEDIQDLAGMTLVVSLWAIGSFGPCEKSHEDLDSDYENLPKADSPTTIQPQKKATKRKTHRHPIVAALTSCNKRFFLGTDSAPHDRLKKERAYGWDTFSWFRDEEFCRQMLAGLNPYSIQLVTEWQLKSKLDPEVYAPAESAITKDIVEEEIRGFMTLEERFAFRELQVPTGNFSSNNILGHSGFGMLSNSVRLLHNAASLFVIDTDCVGYYAKRMSTPMFVDLEISTQADEAQSSRVPVSVHEDPYEAIRLACLVETDTKSEPFEDPVETETPE